MERKHFFAAAVLTLTLAISGCTEVTPPEFNNPHDPLTASFTVPAPLYFRAKLNSSTEAAFEWDSWTYEKGSTIERSVNNGPFEKLAVLPAFTTEYVDSGLDTTKNYSYRVKRFTDLSESQYTKIIRLQPPQKGSLKMKSISSSAYNAGAFSHNGNLLATVYFGKFNQIVLWSVPQYGMDNYIDLWSGPVKALAFSSDDKLLACGTEDGSIYLYDANSRALNNTVKGIIGGITSLDFSPDGRFMAVALKNNDILIYETSSWSLAYTLSRHFGLVNSVCFSKDGSLLASGSDDNSIILWNTADWTVQRTIPTGEGAVRSVTFSPDGKLIAAAAGMSYCQYETATGNKVKSFSTDGGQAALSAAFSNDGKRFAGACGTGVSIFDSNNQPLPLDYGSTSTSQYSFNLILAAPGDGQFVTVGYPIGIWAPGGWTISYQ